MDVQFGSAMPFGSCEKDVRTPDGRVLTCGFPLRVDGTCTSTNKHLTYTCPDCPLCGSPPRAIIGDTQALCGNDDCVALFWNPSITPAANLADQAPLEERDG